MGKGIKITGEYYSGRTKNDYHKSVEILDQFTKEYCIDVEKSNTGIFFQCNNCPFLAADGEGCLVKHFKNQYYPEYKDFGSMGDH